MNGARLDGLREVTDRLNELSSSLDKSKVLAGAAEIFAARLRAATPTGYSGRLQESVIYEVDESGAAFIGYESGVETAGNPALDSVIRATTSGESVIRRSRFTKKGRSVLRWVPVRELSTILEETLDSYSSEGVLYIEGQFANVIS